MAFTAAIAAIIIFVIGGIIGYYIGINQDDGYGYEDVPEELEER